MGDTQDSGGVRPDGPGISQSFLGLDFAKYLLSSDKKRYDMDDQTPGTETGTETGTESDRSELSDGDVEFAHTFSPGSRGAEMGAGVDEYGIYYGEMGKFPQMFDTSINSGSTGNLFDSVKRKSELFDDDQRKNSEHMQSIITKLNSSYSDSAYGTSHSLYAINESGSTVTETSESDTNSDDTVSNSGSPVHNPVYGRYQKLPSLSKPHDPSPEPPTVSSHETLMLDRLPGENLGMILGIEGGKDSFGKVSSVSVKSVTLDGAAYRATGSQKGVCVGDEILTVNGTDLRSLTHDECITVFKDMPLRVQLAIQRGQKDLPAVAISPLPFACSRGGGWGRRDVSDSEDEALGGFAIFQVDVIKEPDENLGLSIVPSYGSTKEFYQIKRILPSGAAARSSQLRVGDRLITCNGQQLQGLTQNHCLNILRRESSYGDVQLEVVRPIDNGSSMEISVTLNNSQLPGFDPSQYSVKSQNYDRHTDVVVTSESEDYLTVSEDEYSRTRLADIPEVEVNEVFSNNNFKLAFQNQFNTIEEDTTEAKTEPEPEESNIPSDVDIVDLNVDSSPYHIPKEKPAIDINAGRSILKSGYSVPSSNLDNISVGSASPRQVPVTELDSVSLGSEHHPRQDIPSTELDNISINSAYQGTRQQLPATNLDTVSLGSVNDSRSNIPSSELDNISIGSAYQNTRQQIPPIDLDTVSIGSSKDPRPEIPSSELDNISIGSAYQNTRQQVPTIDLDSVSITSIPQQPSVTDIDSGSICSANKDPIITDIATVNSGPSYKVSVERQRQLPPDPRQQRLPATDLDTVSLKSSSYIPKSQQAPVPFIDIDSVSITSSNKDPVVTNIDTVSLGSSYSDSISDQREFAHTGYNLPSTDFDIVSCGDSTSNSQVPVPYIDIDSLRINSGSNHTSADSDTVSSRFSYKDSVPPQRQSPVTLGQNLPATDLDTVSLSSGSYLPSSRQTPAPVIDIDTVSLSSTNQDTDTVSVGSGFIDFIADRTPSTKQKLPATDLDSVSLSSRSSTTSHQPRRMPVNDIDKQRGSRDLIIRDAQHVNAEENVSQVKSNQGSQSNTQRVSPANFDLVIPHYRYSIHSSPQQQTSDIEITSTSFKLDNSTTETDTTSINTNYENYVPLRITSPRQYYSKPHENLFSASEYNNQHIDRVSIESSETLSVSENESPSQEIDGDMEIALPPPVEFSDTLTEPTSDNYMLDNTLQSDTNTFTFVSDTGNVDTSLIDIAPVHQNSEIIALEDQIPTEELLQLEASFRALEEEAADDYQDTYQELEQLEELPYESTNISDLKLAQCYEVVAPIPSISTEKQITGDDSFNVPAEFADSGDEILQVIQSHDTNTIEISLFTTKEQSESTKSSNPEMENYSTFVSTMDKNSEAMLKDALDLEYEILPEDSKFRTRIALGAYHIGNELLHTDEENPVAENIAREMLQNETGRYSYYDDEPDEFPTADAPEPVPDLPMSAPPDIPFTTPYHARIAVDNEIVTTTTGLNVKLVPSVPATIDKHRDSKKSYLIASNRNSQILKTSKDDIILNTNHSDKLHAQQPIVPISHNDVYTEQKIVPTKSERKVEITAKLFQPAPEPANIVPIEIKRTFQLPVNFSDNFLEKPAETSAPLHETIVQPRQIVTVATKSARPNNPPRPSPRKLQGSHDKPIIPPKPSHRWPAASLDKHISVDTANNRQSPVNEDVVLPTKVKGKENQILITYKEPEPVEEEITPTVVQKDRMKVVNNVIGIVNSMKDTAKNDATKVISSVKPIESRQTPFYRAINHENMKEGTAFTQEFSPSTIQNINKESTTLKQPIESVNSGRIADENVLSAPKQDIIVTSRETIRKPMSSTSSKQELKTTDSQHKSLWRGNGMNVNNVDEPRKSTVNIPATSTTKLSDEGGSHIKQLGLLDIDKNNIPPLNFGSSDSNSDALSPSSVKSNDLSGTAFKTKVEVSNSQSQNSSSVPSVKTSVLPTSPDGLLSKSFSTSIDVTNSGSDKSGSVTIAEPTSTRPTTLVAVNGLTDGAYKTTIDVTTVEREGTTSPPGVEKPVLAPKPQIKPISVIQPRSFNPKSLVTGPRAVQYKTTISTLGMKPAGLSILGRASTLGSPPKMDHPIKRMETLPFEVSILKGILGIGIKTTMTPDGLVKITEILPSGPVGREGNIQVGDYLLSINRTELTGLPDSKVQQILRLLPRGLSKIVASAVPPDPSHTAAKAAAVETASKKSLSLAAPRQMTITTAPKPLLLSQRHPVPKTMNAPLPGKRPPSRTDTTVVSPRSQTGSVSPSVSPRSPSQPLSPRQQVNISRRHAPPVPPKPKRVPQTSDSISKTAPAVKTDYVTSATKEEKSSPPLPIVPPPVTSQTTDYVLSARKSSPRGSKDAGKDVKTSDKVPDENGPIETEIFVSISGPKDEHVPKQQTGSIVLPGSVKYDSVDTKTTTDWTPGIVSSADIGRPLKTKDILMPIAAGKIDVVDSMPLNTDNKREHEHITEHEHAPAGSSESRNVVTEPAEQNTADEKGNQFCFNASIDSEFEFELDRQSPPRKRRSMSTSSESSYTEFTDCSVEDNIIPEQIDEEIDSDSDTSLDIKAENQKPENVPKLSSGTVNSIAKPRSDNTSDAAPIGWDVSQDSMCNLNVVDNCHNDGNISTGSYEEHFETDDDLNEKSEEVAINKADNSDIFKHLAQVIVSDVFSNIKESDLISSKGIQTFDVDNSEMSDDSGADTSSSDDDDDDEGPPPVPLSAPPVPTSEVPDDVEPATNIDSTTTSCSVGVVNADIRTDFTHDTTPSQTSEHVDVTEYRENMHVDTSIETHIPNDIIEVSYNTQVHAEPPVKQTNTVLLDSKPTVSDSVLIQEEDLPKGFKDDAIHVHKHIPGLVETTDLDQSVGTVDNFSERDNDESIHAVISLYSNIEKSLCSEDKNQDAFKVTEPAKESNAFYDIVDAPRFSVAVRDGIDAMDSCDTKSITSSEDLLSDSDTLDTHVFTHIDTHVHPTNVHFPVDKSDRVKTSAVKVDPPAKLSDIHSGNVNGHRTIAGSSDGFVNPVVTSPISLTFSDTLVEDGRTKGKYSFEADQMIRLMSADEEPSATGEGEIIVIKMNKGVTGVGFVIQGGKGSPKGDQPISIRRLFKGGPAEQCGQLKVNDELLEVNSEDFTTMRHNDAWQNLKFLPSGEITMKVRRYSD